jgi:transaldolase / glucose-6-phosphate isomerase
MARAKISGGNDSMVLDIGKYVQRIKARLYAWEQEGFLQRMWAKDHTLWSTEAVPELADRLGWLFLPESMKGRLEEFIAFSEEAKMAGIKNVLLLGMGGSSLAPELFQQTFGNRKGYPALAVLDSTHPVAVRKVEAGLDLERTLFVVSSKSGGTTETNSFFKYFWKKVSDISDQPGRQFVAITDPGTSLARLAAESRFRQVFDGDPEVGGRYSALSPFGLVPAALMGMDVRRLLGRAAGAAGECGAGIATGGNCAGAAAKGASGLVLGAVLGELALAGRDKLTFIVSKSLASLPAWLEQLVAESTGKMGKGIVTVTDEPEMPAARYGKDRLFVFIDLKGDRDDHGALAEKLAMKGHPVVRIHLADKYDIGCEMYRWEVATAAAGAILGINPFDQPDVQLAKDMAKKAMAGDGAGMEDGAVTIPAEDLKRLEKGLKDWLKKAKRGDYLAIMAFLPPDGKTTAALQELRSALNKRTGLPTTMGYGPRFLHSTGQLHKGGPDSGLFLQIVDDVKDELAVPETDYTFGRLVRAQALGDFAALGQRGRRAVRVNVSKGAAGGIASIARLVAR